MNPTAIMRRMMPMVLLVLLAVAVPACGESSLESPGAFQIATGRDIQVVVDDGAWWTGDTVVFQRGIGPQDLQLWMYHLGAAEPELLDRGAVSYWWFLRDPDGTPRAVAVATGTTPGAFAIHPLDGSPRIDISGVDTSIGVLRPGRCVVARYDVAEEHLLGGPCDALQPLAPELNVVTMVDGGDGHVVVSARPSNGAVGIYDVAPDGKVTQLVAPMMGEVDLPPGTTPLSPLASGTVYGDQTLVRECWSGNCHLLYRRKMTDGSFRPFMYRYDTQREVALPGGSYSYEFWRWWFYPGNPRLVLWSIDEGTATRLSIWNLETDTVKTCLLAFQQNVSSPLPGLAWRPDAGAFMVRGGASDADGVTVVSAGPEPCSPLEMGVYFPSFASDNGAVSWQRDARAIYDGQTTDLWMADGVGRDQRFVASIPNLVTHDIISRDELLVRYTILDGTVLAVVRTADEAPAPRALAGQVFGTTVELGGRRLLTGTALNADDAAGNLTTVNLDTGERRDLDTAVNWYQAGKDAALYTVRGRYASSRDGLWVRRLE